MNKAVFLDRDGTINVDYGYVYRTADLELISGVVDALKRFEESGYLLIVITNQSGIGRGFYNSADTDLFHKAMTDMLVKQGVTITDYFICPHAPEENCECRKPLPQLVERAIEKYNIDTTSSFMFGDKLSDVECGERLGIESFLVTSEHSLSYWAGRIIKR